MFSVALVPCTERVKAQDFARTLSLSAFDRFRFEKSALTFSRSLADSENLGPTSPATRPAASGTSMSDARPMPTPPTPNGFGVGGVGMGLASDMLVPLAAGLVAGDVGPKFSESAKDLEKVKADFSNLNLSKADNDSVLAKSWALTRSVHGTSATENMALIQDLHVATGDLHHSLEMSDAYAKYTVASSIQNNGKGVEN